MPSRPSGDFQAAASRWALVFIGRCGGTWSQEVKCGKWVFWPWAAAAIHSPGATTGLTCLLRLSSDSRGTLKLGTGGVHSSQLQTTSYSFSYQVERPLTGVVCKPHRRQTGLVALWIQCLLGSLVEGDEGSGRGFLQEGSQLCGGPYGPLGKNVSAHPKPAHLAWAPLPQRHPTLPRLFLLLGFQASQSRCGGGNEERTVCTDTVPTYRWNYNNVFSDTESRPGSVWVCMWQVNQEHLPTLIQFFLTVKIRLTLFIEQIYIT